MPLNKWKQTTGQFDYEYFVWIVCYPIENYFLLASKYWRFCDLMVSILNFESLEPKSKYWQPDMQDIAGEAEMNS